MYKLSTSARIKIDWCPKDSLFDLFGDYCLENVAVKIFRLTFSEPSVTLFCCVCMWDSTVRHDRGRLITPYSLNKIKIRFYTFQRCLLVYKCIERIPEKSCCIEESLHHEVTHDLGFWRIENLSQPLDVLPSHVNASLSDVKLKCTQNFRLLF